MNEKMSEKMSQSMPVDQDRTDKAGVDKAHAGRLMKSASYASVCVAVTLIVAKLGAWVVTDSVAVLSTLIDSLLDAAASIITLFAVYQSLVPADREHRFGHGKAEALAALGQAAFITGSACLLVFEAVRRFFQPHEVTRELVGIAVMVFSIVLTLALVQFQRYVVRRTGSVAISADSLHYVGDLLVNAAVIAALAATAWLGWHWIDPVLALLVAGYILFSAWRIVRGSLDMLMDRELPDDERARIREIAMAHPQVLAMHDLRSRRAGTDTFIQLHIEIDGGLTVMEAHEISDAVEEEIRAAFPNAEVIIHQDPEGLDEDHAKVAYRA
ncbi:MAG TPA: cation diffusion facilitator family transporter [Alphaproteobacteria bacterium]|nr:cation diffusion facilitator family transporter [Alphaproteobacteria bacterium]